MKQLFNDNWLFAKAAAGISPDEAANLEFHAVDIPHDWLIYDSNKLYETSCGVYRRTIAYNAEGSVRLYFGGVYMNCTLYVNGVQAGENKYGYSSFEIDVTPHLHAGENELLMLVRHDAPNTRWYSGAGIFRDIYLIKTPADHLATDGVYFHAEKRGDMWRCALSAETVGAGEVTAVLAAPDGRTLWQGGCGEFEIANAPDIVWDIDSPNLLTLTVTMSRGGQPLDSVTQNVGLRTAEFTPNGGFFLNGRHVKLHGVCLHHDLGPLGAAFNKEAARRQLLSMKEMGANSVRTSHNMPDSGFMELCDELGVLVDSEAFDMWERPKTEFDYARFFDEWYERDVASWVRRDRNHPSVIMWSVGNEIYDTHVSPRGREVAKMLHAAVRKHDPLKNAPTTIGSNYMPWQPAQLCADEVDLAGYNYGESLYEPHHAAHPDRRIYGSETTSGVKSRGVYHFPLGTAFLTHDDLQCSSLGNCRAGASADTPQKILAADLAAEFCAGMYIWTGSDYLGEPSPYSTRNSYYGSIDTAGLRKDSFWLYQAAWTDKPVLHLFPYWDFNDGQLVDVCAYTNLESAELFVNGVSAGVRTPEEWTVSWQVPYKRGKITVAGYDKDGREYRDEQESFGSTAALRLSCGKTALQADGRDFAAIVVTAVDGDGRPVRNARDRVTITVEGARLVGFDAGDSTDYDSCKSSCRKLFSGMAAAYIMSSQQAGEITVRAFAEGAEPAALTLKALPCEAVSGVSANESIAPQYSQEIPLRKIELTREGGALVTPQQPEVRIRARLLPENATHRELCWSVVTPSGIKSSLAQVTPTEDGALLKVQGDGEFRLRCTCANGKPQPEVVSDFEFTAQGFGQPFTDPYSFVTGCFYKVSGGLMDEVSGGGIAMTAEKNTVGYTKVDFGKNGAQALTVRIIHWHTNDPVNIRLYTAKNGGEKRLVGEFTYQADFIWQTYQDNTFELPEPIFGEQDVFFEFGEHEQRLYFGGFVFTPRLGAYRFTNASDADLVHGDSFEISGGSVLGIGNNVTLEFAGMDFSKGVSALEITGRTRHDNDSIHVHIIGESTMREIVEFGGSDGVRTVRVPLGAFSGKAAVQFRFLPGCDFDFAGFRFIPAE